MCQVALEIPTEVLYDTHMNSSDARDFARKWVALGYFVHNKVSIGYCAEIAGLTEEEFISFLGANQIDLFQFANEDELMKDAENA